VAWFYATVFLVPAAVIGAGVMVTRNKRRKSPAAGSPPATPPATGPGGVA
jgi:hypothetical protein